MASSGGVSFPGTGVSLATSMGVSLTSATLYFPASGVVLLNIQVSLFTTAGTSAPPSGGQLVFNTNTASMYVPIIAAGWV